MASRPNPNACLKCATPMVPNAAFCGTCGTPAGSTGTPPMPPPMPARPIGLGARQVVIPGDTAQAIQAAAMALPAVSGEVTHHGPAQLGFRMGSFFWGRTNGTIDAYPEGPGRSALKVTMKPDYSSLVPGAAGLIVVSVISAILIGKSAVDQMYGGYNPMAMQIQAPGIGAYLQWWMFLLFDVIAIGVAAWMLAGPVLDKRRNALINALQSQGAAPPMMGGMPQPGGFAPQGFAPQVAPAAPGQAAPAQATPFEQLRKLAELRDSGAITADDYDKAKAAIIAKLA
jgi:hypothetical protein